MDELPQNTQRFASKWGFKSSNTKIDAQIRVRGMIEDLGRAFNKILQPDIVDSYVSSLSGKMTINQLKEAIENLKLTHKLASMPTVAQVYQAAPIDVKKKEIKTIECDQCGGTGAVFKDNYCYRCNCPNGLNKMSALPLIM